MHRISRHVQGAADLRLIGDMCSDPLTKAIRNHVPAFRTPVWSDDVRQVLVLLGESRSDAVSAAIRRVALRFVETLDWPLGFQAVERIFVLKRRLHLLRIDPSVTWVTFSEPQLTTGFAKFLNAPELVVRIERVRALLKALGAAELGQELS